MRPDAPALPSSLRRDLTPALDGAGAGGGAGAEQAPADTHAVDASVTRQGWLYKLSTTAVMPHWTRRWFVLCGGSLYYFNSASVTTEPTLFAHLRDVEVHAQPPQAPGRGAPRQQICFALGPRRAAGGSVAGSVASGSCGGSFSASRGRTAANAGGGGGGGARLDPLHRPLSEGDAGSLGGAISPAASAASGPGSSASGQSDPSAARARTPVRGGARKKRPGSGQSTPPRAPPAPPTLFLAADTVDGKYGWVRQLEAARALPPCPVLSLKTALERAARQRNVDVNLLAASLGEAEAEAEGLRGALDEARAEAEALRAAVQYKDAQLWTLSQAIDSALPAPMRMLRRWLAPRVVDDAPVARGAGPWQLWRFGGGGGGGGSGGLGRMGTGTRRSRLDRLSRQDLGLPDDAAHPAHLAHPEHGSFWNPARAGAAGEVSGVPLSFHKSPLMYVGMSGWLTKQSKGGYTTNWNRRWFVLIEGSLYYTSSPEMDEEPKLFCHLLQCQLLPFVEVGKEHAFGLWTPLGGGEELGVQLLLHADSAIDRYEWLEAIEEHLELPAVEPEDAQALCEGRYLLLDVGERKLRNAALNQMARSLHTLQVPRGEQPLGLAGRAGGVNGGGAPPQRNGRAGGLALGAAAALGSVWGPAAVSAGRRDERAQEDIFARLVPNI